MSYLAFNLNTLTLTLERFVSAELPRIYVQSGELERTANNTLVLTGQYLEPPHLWDFEALITPTERNQLSALYWEQQRLIRSRAATFPIVLTDATQPYQELSPRTRGKASAPYDAEAAPYSGFVSYYAKFNVVFAAPPIYTQSGNRLTVQLQLQETNTKVAP